MKRFLFLQGPHGPFFAELSDALMDSGSDCVQIGFNSGDETQWHRAPRRARYRPFHGGLAEWQAALPDLLAREAISDLVLYGDSRPLHRAAIDAARAQNITVHCFEEGYLRPYWATYERDGSNGNSPLNRIGLAKMRAMLREEPAVHLPPPPALWGNWLHHGWHGACYHARLLRGQHRYPAYRTHRALPIATEFRLSCQRLASWPAHMLGRRLATRALFRTARPYHVVLLQLSHDAAVQIYSDMPSMQAFAAQVIEAFARGAPPHHQLVFKAHPLDDGRENLPRIIKRLARSHGLEGRVHFIPGGKLGPLLDQATSAVTVNSTAGQQALWRGLPLWSCGRSVYARPEFIARQPLEAFFAAPTPPDLDLYRVFRQTLLETSQIPGGFYTSAARTRLIRQAVSLMDAANGPYARLESDPSAKILPFEPQSRASQLL